MATGDGSSNGGLSKPITQVVSALHGTPMLLALLVLNVLILGMVVYLAKARSETMAEERTEILKLLDDCLARQKSSIVDPRAMREDNNVHRFR